MKGNRAAAQVERRAFRRLRGAETQERQGYATEIDPEKPFLHREMVMKLKICLALLLLAGVLAAGGCEQQDAQTAEAAAGTAGADGYASRTDFSLIPNDGLQAMDRELARREEVIVSGQERRVDASSDAAELARIRAERNAIAEEAGKR